MIYYRARRLAVTGLAVPSLVIAACGGILGGAFCAADEPPTARQFARNVSALRADSQAVQGTFRVYRIDEVRPDAVTATPGKSEIPLVRSGKLWRSPERFRANFKTYSYNASKTIENSHAYAFDSHKLYEFTVGFNPDAGSLRVFDPTAPDAAGTRRSIDVILWSLDALWSNGGVAFDELVQRPEVRIVAGTGGTFSVVYRKGGDENRLDFDQSRNHPFVRMVAISKHEDDGLRMERHVDFVEVGQAVYPSRIIDVCSLEPGRGGYTEIVELDLAPLEDDSPVENDFTADSFRDLGFGYNVSRFEQSDVPTMVEHFPRPVQATPPSRQRTYFLWLNGFFIVAIFSAIVYRYVRRRSGHST